MTGLITFLADHGLMLLAGSTGLLAVATLAAGVVHSPAHRQRIAEFGIAAAIIWTVLACLPLPRADVWPVPAPATTDSVQAEVATAVPRPPVQDAVVFDGQIPPEVIARPNIVPGPIAAPRGSGDPGTTDAIEPVFQRAASTIHWRRVAAWAFAVGAGAMGAWMLAGRAILSRLIRRSSPPPEWLWDLLASEPEARQLRPRLLVSRELSRPVSFGLWRASIVLPAGLVEPAKRQCVRQVLLHELAHLSRGDGWGNLVLNLATIGFYFHPLFWWLRAQAALSRELVADDWAARRGDRRTYVQELLTLARMDSGGRLQAAATIGILGSTSQFYRRMHMLLGRQTELATRCSRNWRIAIAAGWGIALASAVTMVGVRPAGAQDKPVGGGAPGAPIVPGAAPAPAPAPLVRPGGNYVGDITFEKTAPSPIPAPAAREVEPRLDEQLTGAAVQNYARARELDRLTEAEFKLSSAVRSAQNAYDYTMRLVKKGESLPEIDKAIDNDPPVAAFQRDLMQLKIKSVEAAEQFGKDHVDVKKLERLMELTRNQLEVRRQELRAKLTAQLTETLKAAIAQAQADLEVVQKRLERLQQDLDVKAAVERNKARVVADKALADAMAQPPVAIPGAGISGIPGMQRNALPGVIPPALPQAAMTSAVGGVQLDLVNLANSSVNAVGTLRLAEADLERLKQLARTASVSQQELSHAEADFQTAKRRVNLFRGLIQVSLVAADRELKAAHVEFAQGRAPHSREEEATTKVEMLKLILASMD